MDIKSIPDDMITAYPRGDTGFTDYRLGNVTVSYRGQGRFLCMTCQGVDRFRDHTHRGCDHCRRIARFRDEHQAELNVVKSDPALEAPIA